MKKFSNQFFLVSFLLLMGTFVAAQNKIMQIYEDGIVTNAIDVSQIDSINFINKIDDINKMTTVSLMESGNYSIFEKTVILFEDENYLIKTPLFYFLSDISDPFIYSYNQYLSTLEKILSDGKTHDLLYSSSYFNTHQINFVLALFLENGHCYFYDKKNGNNIKQVVVEYWGYSPAPLAGAGGRRFYINNNVLFLETVDWIS